MADEKSETEKEETIDGLLDEAISEVDGKEETPQTNTTVEAETTTTSSDERDEKIAKLEEMVSQSQDTIKELKTRIDDSEAILANPDVKRSAKEEQQEPDYDELEPKQFARTLKDQVVGEVSKLIEAKFAPIARKEQEKEKQEVISQAKQQVKACQEKYKDWSKYKKQVQEIAITLENKHGLQALTDFGIERIYRDLRFMDAEKRASSKTPVKSGEKPSTSIAATTEVVDKDKAFDNAWDASGIEGDSL